MPDHITTYTKIHLNPLKPDPKGIVISDIAHALSLMVRANGHFPEFYSVGQHCIHCAREAMARGWEDQMVLACLLHDASEAYMADITRPVKQHLPAYKAAEEQLLEVIYQKYLGKVPDEEESRRIKEIDDTLFYYEFLHYMGEAQQDAPPFICQMPEFRTREFKKVEQEYLDLFSQVVRK